MPSFSAKSKAHLAGVHPDLQRLFNTVVSRWDCTIIDGLRTIEQQREYVRRGVSKTLASKHLEGLAVDVAPYPVRWHDTERFYAFGGYVIGIAHCLGLDVRWGGDWDSDRDFSDQSFNDLVHFELRNA